jgi:hypothetical protein
MDHPKKVLIRDRGIMGIFRQNGYFLKVLVVWRAKLQVLVVWRAIRKKCGRLRD